MAMRKSAAVFPRCRQAPAVVGALALPVGRALESSPGSYLSPLLRRAPGGAVAELGDVGSAVVHQLSFGGVSAGVVQVKNLARRQRAVIDAGVVDGALEV